MPPAIARDAWPENSIDRFILHRLRGQGLAPSPRADPRTLVRRAYFDLLGLPAPPEAIDRFAGDPSRESWARLVDELLTSPHYGERWARHWLDVARYGESDGYEYNALRPSAWHYRDWVIRSMNLDLPYDEFARMQLAGDVMQPGTVDGAAAVGFLVAGIHNPVLGVSPAMKLAGRHQDLEEIAGTVAQAILGLTVHCARCHDHKFDPISAREYYQFISALDGVHHGKRDVSIDAEPVEEIAKLEGERAALRARLVDLVSSRGGVVSNTANRIRMKKPIPANREDTSYRVAFDVAPSVWANPSQATTQRDGILVRILRDDGTVLVLAPFRDGSLAWNAARVSTARVLLHRRWTRGRTRGAECASRPRGPIRWCGRRLESHGRRGKTRSLRTRSTRSRIANRRAPRQTLRARSTSAPTRHGGPSQGPMRCTRWSARRET